MHDIPIQVTSQDSALIHGLQNINKMFNSMENNLYALRAEKMKDLEDNVNHQVDQVIEIETYLQTILKIALETLKTDIEE